jgi:hypothetical protein
VAPTAPEAGSRARHDADPVGAPEHRTGRRVGAFVPYDGRHEGRRQSGRYGVPHEGRLQGGRQVRSAVAHAREAAQ